MITLKFCPICDSSQITKYPQMGLAPRVAYEVMPGIKVNAIVVAYYFLCQNCHVIFQNPRLSNLELNKFYSQGYYRQTINSTEEEIDRDEKNRAKLDAQIIRQFIGKVSSHLDIGSSRGYLLEAIGAKDKVGVEPNVSYLRVKGVRVYPEINKVSKRTFDLVTAIHTLEHEPAPLDYLKSMVKFISKSGYLVVEVPTWKSPAGPLRLAHLFHFEPDVLKLMCREVGLKVVHVEFTPHLILICKTDNL